MDHFDKVVRDRCCHLTEGQKLKSGLKTHKQVKDALRVYKSKGVAKHFAGEAQLLNPNIKEQLIEPSILAPEKEMGVRMPVPEDHAIRPVPVVVPVAPPVDETGLIQQRIREQRDQALATNLMRQESIRSQLEEVAELVEEKIDRGDEPDPADLSKIERLERQLQRVEDENTELKFEIGRQKELVRVQAAREMEALEEGSRAELEAVRAKGKAEQTKMRSEILEADKDTLLSFIEIESELVYQLTAELPASQRKYKSVLERSGARTIAKYLLDTLQIPEETIYTMTGLGLAETETDPSAPGPSGEGPTEPAEEFTEQQQRLMEMAQEAEEGEE